MGTVVTGESLAGCLPGHLRERLLSRGGERVARGEFVLCWLHHALRVEANPVLDAARTAAAALDLPLLIYQGLGGAHRYHNDRHHRFILECARDLAVALAPSGHRLSFHLPTDPARPGPLASLADRAALVVSELYPVPPFSSWYRSAVGSSTAPWWFLDAACVVPMPLSQRRFDRAFEFRRAWEREYEVRVGQAWPVCRAEAVAFAGDPGFEPLELTGDGAADLAEAVAACRIDHLVGPVGDTVGGLHAARDRWDRFRARGLAGYAGQRNDAAVAWPRGVSRLSPYLHYGCIAPTVVATEAAAATGRGAEKFLDELLIWRELAHHFCFRTPDPEGLSALPGWAVETLQAHRGDPRERRDWESLARGRTGDMLWDLAQRSLLRQGELHNNVRMTWAKALLGWTGGPEEALARLVDLNHRYALDGSDPNSYGGILWSLGQFDRPFDPPQPITGRVRARSTAAHGRRLDLDAYRTRVSQPTGGRALRCVVVGAGISGLVAARCLADHGHDVVVVDKGRRPGGRASTRRQGDLHFDHGAQYFTARNPNFRRYVDAWVEQGLVARWEAPIGVVENGLLRATEGEHERFVGVPGMDAICGHLAQDLKIHQGWTASAVDRSDGLLVRSEEGDELPADVVIVSTPPAQASALLASRALSLPALPELEPTWAVLARFDRALFDDFGGLFVNDGPLGWLARMRGRPGRPATETWVLHASPTWTRKHLEGDRDRVTEALVAAARDLPGAAAAEALDASAHRWRYARADDALDVGALWFEDAGIGLCGDWLHGSRIEGAFLSGAAAAGRVLGSRLALGR